MSAPKHDAKKKLEAQLLAGLNSPSTPLTAEDWKAMRAEVFGVQEAKKRLEDDLIAALREPGSPMTKEDWDAIKLGIHDS